jgi:hypothetical protein
MLLSIRYALSSPLTWWFGGRVLLPWGIIFLVIDVATMVLILSCYLYVLFRRIGDGLLVSVFHLGFLRHIHHLCLPGRGVLKLAFIVRSGTLGGVLPCRAFLFVVEVHTLYSLLRRIVLLAATTMVLVIISVL